MTKQEHQSYMLGTGEHNDPHSMPMTYAPVTAPPNIQPFLKQVNRYEYFREYAEYWWVGSRTYLLKALVFLALGVMVALVTPLGALLFFALAGRCHSKSWWFNIVVNNPGRSLVLTK